MATMLLQNESAPWVERETLVEATPEEVWAALTDEDRLEEWMAPDVELDPIEGGEIQDDTILDVIQELRAAGAEAMEFNDKVRVIAQTSVEDTGAGIAVDGQVLDAPYVIDVIGEPTTLAGSLDFATGPVDRVRDEGGTIKFEEPDEVRIDSVVKGSPPRYAEPR